MFGKPTDMGNTGNNGVPHNSMSQNIPLIKNLKKEKHRGHGRLLIQIN